MQEHLPFYQVGGGLGFNIIDKKTIIHSRLSYE